MQNMQSCLVGSAVLGVGPCAANVNDCDAGIITVNDKISVSWNYTVPLMTMLATIFYKALFMIPITNHSIISDLLLNISLNGNVVNSFNLSGNDNMVVV